MAIQTAVLMRYSRGVSEGGGLWGAGVWGEPGIWDMGQGFGSVGCG